LSASARFILIARATRVGAFNKHLNYTAAGQIRDLLSKRAPFFNHSA